jgi:CRP-like cAMP-binding protein
MFYCECKQCSDCVIDDSPILGSIDDRSKKELCSFLFTTQYHKKQIVALEGNPSQNIYIAKKGDFKAYKSLQNGKQQIIRFYNRGDFIQLNSLYEPSYTETVETITPAETCTINKSEFESYLEKNPKVMLKIIKILTKELTLANETISELGQKNARARVAGFLMSFVNLQAHEHKSLSVEVPLSRTEMANKIGITQETLIRLFNDLKKEDIIEIVNHSFIIKNIPRLLKIAR